MIEFSERESKLFNLRFGRATINSDFDQWNEVQKAINDLKLDYLRLERPEALERARRPRVIEIVPCAEQTAKFWEAWT